MEIPIRPLRTTAFVLATALVVSISRAVDRPAPTGAALRMSAADLRASLRPTCRVQRSDGRIPSIGATMYVPSAHHRQYRPYADGGAFAYDIETMAPIQRALQHRRTSRPPTTHHVYAIDRYDGRDADDGDAAASDESGDALMSPRYPESVRRSRFGEQWYAAPTIPTQARHHESRPTSTDFGGNLQTAPSPYDLQPQYDDHAFDGYRSALQKRYRPHRDYFAQPSSFRYDRSPPDRVAEYPGYARPFDRYLVRPAHVPLYTSPDVFFVPKTKSEKAIYETIGPNVVVLDERTDAGSEEEAASIDDADASAERSEEDVLFRIAAPTMKNGSDERNGSENFKSERNSVQDDNATDRIGDDVGDEKRDEELDAMVVDSDASIMIKSEEEVFAGFEATNDEESNELSM